MRKGESDMVTAPFWQYPSTQRQLRVINCWRCGSGNEGIAWIFDLIFEVLTFSIVTIQIIKRKTWIIMLSISQHSQLEKFDSWMSNNRLEPLLSLSIILHNMQSIGTRVQSYQCNWFWNYWKRLLEMSTIQSTVQGIFQGNLITRRVFSIKDRVIQCWLHSVLDTMMNLNQYSG